MAARYRELSDDAVRRHAKHLPAGLVQAADVAKVASAGRTLAQLDRCLERVNRLFDACDDWLRDPEDPSRYDLGPRAGDVKVIYEEIDEQGKRAPRKAALSELLARVAGIAPGIRLVETKHADPRELLLQTSRRLEGASELMARLVGELQDVPTLNVILSPEWTTLRRVILTTLVPYPDAQRALVAALEPRRAKSCRSASIPWPR